MSDKRLLSDNGIVGDAPESQLEDLSSQRPEGKIERYDINIVLSLRRITRAIDTYSHKLKTEYHITAPQLICLLEIVEEGPLTSSGLSRKVHISKSTLVGILDRLEQKGWIRRERSNEDRRQVYLMATQSGRELGRHAPSPLQDKLVQALGKLSPLEQASIALSLERVADLMEEHSIEQPSTGKNSSQLVSNKEEKNY